MKIYNTLTKQIEEFEPLHPPEVGFYACGFTVYDFTHLGHLRKYTMDDVLIRTLEHAGYKVKFVQNVTDVGHLASDEDTGEDKLEKGAKKYGSSVKAIARKFEDYFFRSMDLMGNKRPDVSCRATEHIQEMKDLVELLEEKGFTYEITDDGIYFDTSQFEDYGELADLNIEGLEEGARVAKVAGKKQPTDFAVWKFERPGENRAMSWPSKWAKKSFPGWHIECSAMSMKYLGPQFDIHTGGIDHIPVHHTNEIAQAEAATGKKPFVKYWVHHNHLMVEGEKMSKSLGNFYTIDDVLERGFEPQALRLLFLSTHYRSQQNFTWDSLAAAQKSWDRLKKKWLKWQGEVDGEEVKLSVGAKNFQEKFFAYLEDDLKTAEALAVLWEVVGSDLSAAEKIQLLKEFDQVFALQLEKVNPEVLELSAEVEQLLEQRQIARDKKQWDLADQLRDELLDQGYEVKDTANGQEVSEVVAVK